jgi:outer membrane protein insertion porin family
LEVSLRRILQVLVCLSSLLSLPASALDSFRVSDIRVEGLQRISPGTVFNFLPVQVGDEFSDYESERTIRALFKSGYFKNVRLERDGDVLVVVVTERPAIANIKIQGNKDLETDALLASLKDIGLAKGQVFDRSLLEKVELELERQYYSRGKYGVKIEATVTPLERNRVDLLIDISEAVCSTIKHCSRSSARAHRNGRPFTPRMTSIPSRSSRPISKPCAPFTRTGVI